MSKIIRMTPEMIEESKRKFEARLRNMNLANGTLTYTETFQSTDQKAVVWFTADAYMKMVALIQDTEKEVAWHGVAHRMDTPGHYVISDIIVYPQKVTGTSVDMDPVEYGNWKMELEDDVVDHLCMQGHSHVRMDCFPSGTDLEHQREIVDQLDGDMFYIFMIWNKYLRYTAKIYDLKINTLFEQGDVSVQMVGANQGLAEFLTEARSMVKPFSASSNYQSNYQNQTKPAATTQNTTAPAATTTAPATTKKDNKPVTAAGNTVPSRPKPCIGNGWSGAANHQNSYDDDYDNPHYGCYN